MLDSLAHRYGRLPHELVELTPAQLGLALAAHAAGVQAAASRMSEIVEGGGIVVPVVGVA